MRRRCDACRLRRPSVSPWVTPGGLVIGHLCDGCRESKAAWQRQAERNLEDHPRPKHKPRQPFYERRHPTDKRIAAELLADPGVLNLRTRRLQADIQQRFHVAPSVARNAVAMARAAG